MRHTEIQVGQTLRLKRERQAAYGFIHSNLEVVRVQPRPGYKDPLIECRSPDNMPEFGFYSPSDFARVV
jgi:hypothetical protein